jgi:hypothetical protein
MELQVMSFRNRFAQYALVAFVGVVLAACANQKEPAQTAINGVDSAINTVSAEAAKYVPDQLADVKAKFDGLKASFDKQDYKAVLAGAPAVLSAAQGLAAAAGEKKDAIMKSLNGDWTGLAASLPGVVSAVQSRVDMLSKSKKVPAGIDLAAAKSGLADATSLWSKAQAAFSAGNLEEAVNTAKDVKAKAEAAAAALKLDLTAPAPAAKK